MLKILEPFWVRALLDIFAPESKHKQESQHKG
jgi:hypothetical protein